MNQSTLKSAIALIVQRWPFPPDADEAAVWYADHLKMAVSSWTGKREDGFKRAVQALLAATNQYGRPSPEQIVELSLSKAGEHGRATNPMMGPDDLAADRERRKRDWEAECERRRADPVEAQKAVDSFARGAVMWRAGSKERRHIAEWLRDFWGVDFQPGEFDAFVAAPSPQRPRFLRKNPVGGKVDGFETTRTVLEEVTKARGFGGLTDAAIGSTEQNKRERADAHRKRVGEAIADWRGKKADDQHDGIDIPF